MGLVLTDDLVEGGDLGLLPQCFPDDSHSITRLETSLRGKGGREGGRRGREEREGGREEGEGGRRGREGGRDHYNTK